LQIITENNEEFFRAKQDLLELEKKYEYVEKTFSRFDEKSELSILNESREKFKEASVGMLEIAQKSIFYNNLTGGFFDPRIINDLEDAGYDKTFECVSLSGSGSGSKKEPQKLTGKLSDDILLDIENGKICFKSRMDFSGIVKGYATDKMAETLSRKGWKNFLVDSGGDIFFAGSGIDRKKWRVDIEGISQKSLMLELSGKGVATSGIGKRKWEKNRKRLHHIINPKTPEKFSFDLQSVSVVAATTEEADVWAKTLFLLGKKEAKNVAEEKKIACAILEYNGRAWISSALKKYIFKQ
jgi:thiamine biosynthesis lipoprotein